MINHTSNVENSGRPQTSDTSRSYNNFHNSINYTVTTLKALFLFIARIQFSSLKGDKFACSCWDFFLESLTFSSLCVLRCSKGVTKGCHKNKIMGKKWVQESSSGFNRKWKENQKVLCHFRANSLPNVQLRDLLNPGLENSVYFFFFFYTFLYHTKEIFFF